MYRREFLGMSLATGLFSIFPGLAESRGGMRNYGVRRLRFGVMSDMHVTTPGRTPEECESGRLNLIRKALVSFREQNVDAVMCCGDITHDGVIEELEAFARVWTDVFPDNRLPSGAHVEKLFIYGNHDSVGYRYDNYAKTHYSTDSEVRDHSIFYDHKKAWERVFHEQYAPIYSKQVKGYTFVGQHWDEADDALHGWHFYDHPRLESWLATHAGELRRDRPVFYFQHPCLKDTTFGPWAWGHDNGSAGRALAKISNAIAFTGHSHYSNTDERSIWQGAFTAVAVGSLRDAAQPNGEFPHGYENGAAPSRVAPDVDPLKLTPSIGGDGSSHQALLVDVYDRCVVISRRDVACDASIGEDWVVPLGVTGESRPYEFDSRKVQIGAPEFSLNAALKVEPCLVKNRGGKGRSGESVSVIERKGYRVDIPPALARKCARPFRYIVEGQDCNGAKVEKNVLACGYSMPLIHLRAKMVTSCYFSCDEFASGMAVMFRVIPVGFYGSRGVPLQRCLKKNGQL